MDSQRKISGAVIRRLPGYYRYLKRLEMEGVQRISSQDLGQQMGLTASQIRQDMNCFGGFGYSRVMGIIYMSCGLKSARYWDLTAVTQWR